jgi:hypoxanthine-DNA glycosylase
MEPLEGFPPIVYADSRILILGSMPSVKSLEMHEYYGHPTNAFWPIMETFCGCPLPDWDAKVDMLISSHIALWDVVSSCERKGSADSAIRNIRFNALKEVLEHYPGISHILCNGTTAMRLFQRYNRNLGSHRIVLPVVPLLSTSAANTVSYEKKCQIWTENLHKLLDLSRL